MAAQRDEPHTGSGLRADENTANRETALAEAVTGAQHQLISAVTELRLLTQHQLFQALGRLADAEDILDGSSSTGWSVHRLRLWNAECLRLESELEAAAHCCRLIEQELRQRIAALIADPPGQAETPAGRGAHTVALRSALAASGAGLITAREDERRLLRRDLHDGLGPTLAALTLGLDTAWALSADQGGSLELQQLLISLKAETQRAVTDMRRLAYGLRPPDLDELGLAGSLREETARLHRAVPALTITLQTSDNELVGLPGAVEVAAYRVVTEALTNVARHARARTCAIRLQVDQGLTAEVCDDGVGLPEGWRAGVGITAMRERVAELGGHLVIENRNPHGTRVAARLYAGEG